MIKDYSNNSLHSNAVKFIFRAAKKRKTSGYGQGKRSATGAWHCTNLGSRKIKILPSEKITR